MRDKRAHAAQHTGYNVCALESSIVTCISLILLHNLKGETRSLPFHSLVRSIRYIVPISMDGH